MGTNSVANHGGDPACAHGGRVIWLLSGQVVDLGPVMLASQFQVTEEGGTYLCTSRALVFEGSILTYNPALNEAEWVPVCRLANDLSWAEERSAMALANYVLHAPAEVA